MTLQNISSSRLFNWMTKALRHSGLSSDDSDTIAQALVTTSLWGIDSHGVARITHYLSRFENGTLNPIPNIEFDKTGLATGSLNGDDGHGIVIMTRATQEAIALAKNTGIGAVGVYNSSHCGAIGLYTRKMAMAEMVGFAFTHADALVVPQGGNKPFFGTNPISIAFPTENLSEPICMDMATSIVPWNYIMNARRDGIEVPLGTGVDSLGNDSSDPNKICAVKPMAEHKGFALAFMIDMLCSVLNGANFGPNMTSMYKDLDKQRKLGSLVITLDPKRFGGKDNFRQAASSIIHQIRNYGENILYPGEPEYIELISRTKQGIPVSEALLEDFKSWSQKLNIDFL